MEEQVVFTVDGQEIIGEVIKRYRTFEGKDRATVCLPDGSVWAVPASDLRPA